MSGTNFTKGVATRTKYSGSIETTNTWDANASTKVIRRTAVIHVADGSAGANGTEITTGFTLPASAIVHDVFVNVLTVDATETVDVGTEGTSNDPNGFLAAVSLATAGLVKGSLADGAITKGALLYEETGTGADVAYASTPCIAAGGDPVSWSTSAGTDTAVFDIIIDYSEVVSEPN